MKTQHTRNRLNAIQIGSWAHPASTPMGVPGTLSLGVKRLRREADHSPPPSAGVKNVWSYISTPQYAIMVWCSVKTQGQLHLHLHPLLLGRSRAKSEAKSELRTDVVISCWLVQPIAHHMGDVL
jgi:hypothetical protein